MSIEDMQPSRRTFVKGALYAAPLIMTLKAEPAFASYGSGAPGPNGHGVGTASHRRARLRELLKGHKANNTEGQGLKALFKHLKQPKQF